MNWKDKEQFKEEDQARTVSYAFILDEKVGEILHDPNFFADMTRKQFVKYLNKKLKPKVLLTAIDIKNFDKISKLKTTLKNKTGSPAAQETLITTQSYSLEQLSYLWDKMRGSSVVFAIYHGKEYKYHFGADYFHYLLSDERINDNTIFEGGIYETKVEWQDIDDLVGYKLCAEYKGKVFEIHQVYREAETPEINLISMDSFAEAFGFTYDRLFGMYTLRINVKEVTKILVEKRSFYQDRVQRVQELLRSELQDMLQHASERRSIIGKKCKLF